MKAIVATRPGGSEVLDLVDLDTPTTQPDELLVAVDVAGVNFIDTYRRSGIYPMPFPHIVGTEGAGVVAAVGSAVTGFAVGDRVAWATSAGAYAEYAVVAAQDAVPVPGHLSSREAAAAMLQGMTAHALARSTYPVAADDVVLLHAAAGGVGQLIAQLASTTGARVLGTVSTDEKETIARRAGVADVIRYDRFTDLTAELPAAVRELTEGHGVNVAYDGVGRSTFDASLASLRPRGMLVLFGGASGQVPPVDLQRLNAAGSVYVTRPNLVHYTADRDELTWRAGEVMSAVADGTLRLSIGRDYQLADAAQAHRDLEGRRSTGKLLVDIG